MKNRSRNTTAAATALLGALALASSAMADTVDLRFTGTGKGVQVKIRIDNDWTNVFAGQLKHNFSNGTGPTGSLLTGDIITFCADITQHVSSTTKTYTITGVESLSDSNPMGLAKAAAIAGLYNYANGAQVLNSASNDFAAAFQIAIWEILTDFSAEDGLSSLSITAGDFRVKQTSGDPLSSGILTHLNALFAHIGDGAPEGISMIGLRSSSAQDQITYIPSAGTATLGALGLACIGRRRRPAC